MGSIFEDYELTTLLRDLRSVKMRPADRARACALASRGTLRVDEIGEGWALVRRFRVQLTALYAARERARRTQGRRQLGLSTSAVAARAQERRDAERIAREDLGI